MSEKLATATTHLSAEVPAREIVVGVDGSPGSYAALRWAAKLATALDASITAVTAWEFPVFITAAGGGLLPGTWDPEADATTVVNDAIGAVFAGTPGFVRAMVSQGHPADVLIQASHSAVMLVVGGRGHGGFTGALLGSVSTAVAHHAKCPVMIVPAEAAA
jgi:nucleotide-binding universal stress UspA family protein